MTKAIDAHTEYVIPTAFPLQQLLHERASVTLNVHFLSCVSFVQPFKAQLLIYVPPALKIHKTCDVRIT